MSGVIGMDESRLTVAARITKANGTREISVFSLTPQGPRSEEEHSKGNTDKTFDVALDQVDQNPIL